jgi:hypothetical protein
MLKSTILFRVVSFYMSMGSICGLFRKVVSAAADDDDEVFM